MKLALNRDEAIINAYATNNYTMKEMVILLDYTIQE